MLKYFGKLKDLFTIILFCLRISLNPASKQCRKYFILNIFFLIASVYLPFLLIDLTSRIIGLFTSGSVTQTADNETIYTFLILCAAVFGIGLSLRIIEQFKLYCDGMYREILNNHIRVLIMEKAASLDVNFFDSPVFYNEMKDASGNVPLIAQTAFQTLDLVRFALQFLIAAICMTGFSKLFALLLALSIIPNVIFQRKQFDALYAWQRDVLSDERKLNYLSDILLSKSYVKDTKLFNVLPFIKTKFSNTWNALFTAKKKLSFKYTALVAASAFLPEFVMVLFILSIGIGVLGKAYTVGEYSYYSGIAGQVLASMYLVVYNYGQLMDGKARIENYLKFMKWENTVKDEGDIEFNAQAITIAFQNVSFRYEKDRPLVLKNISFTISTPDKTAIVGINGSGKSSIVKLMMRFYDPEEGEILLNGINIRRYTQKSIRKCFSTMFQDYPCYAFSVRESVSISDYEKAADVNRIHDSLVKGDAQALVLKLPGGLDTYLTRQYDKAGIELSGGEWQKISAAKTFFREAPVLVLDEPSAALDADSEDRLFKQIESEYADKCAVLISHRLSNVIAADQILVLENGEIIERGTHRQLMNQNGTYSRLFTLQAQKYTPAE